MAPHLDPADIVTRQHAAELSREARIAADRAENEARIREQVERDVPAHLTDEDLAEQRHADFEDWAREKLGPEEIYPESTHEQEEV